MNVHKTAKASDTPEEMDARRGFKGYESKERKKTLKADVQDDTVSLTCKSWMRFVDAASKWEDDYSKYDEAKELLEDINASAEDVNRVVDFLVGCQDANDNFFAEVGIFLSALINNGSDENYEIDANRFHDEIESLGMFNCKNLTIHGNAGLFAGFEAVDGTLTIEGNAGGNVGLSLAGGDVIIKGSTGEIGPRVGAGTITVHGDAGEIGECMSGGKIEVKGELGGIQGGNTGGEIINGRWRYEYSENGHKIYLDGELDEEYDAKDNLVYDAQEEDDLIDKTARNGPDDGEREEDADEDYEIEELDRKDEWEPQQEDWDDFPYEESGGPRSLFDPLEEDLAGEDDDYEDY